jgi:hypothetical protein
MSIDKKDRFIRKIQGAEEVSIHCEIISPIRGIFSNCIGVYIFFFKKRRYEMRSWAGFEPRPFGTEAELVYHYAIDVLLHA